MSFLVRKVLSPSASEEAFEAGSCVGAFQSTLELLRRHGPRWRGVLSGFHFGRRKGRGKSSLARAKDRNSNDNKLDLLFS